MSSFEKIRLYVDASLSQGQDVALSQEHAHYLFAVMRRKIGDRVGLFNGRDGEWSAEIVDLSKRRASVRLAGQVAPQIDVADVRLMFAPVKKARTDFIVEKAVEMGVSQIVPVFTEYTNSDRVRHDRMVKIAVEAAEQCRRMSVPEIEQPMKLSTAINQIDPSCNILIANERTTGGGCVDISDLNLPVILLIGPEGGFSDKELTLIEDLKVARSISLGPRILRADTAVVAGLAYIQSRIGDWT